MLHAVYIISKSGTNLVDKLLGKKEQKFDPSLLSGFISAITNFADAIGQGHIKAMRFANNSWFYINKGDIIGICIADQYDDEKVIESKFLLPLIDEFLNKYRSKLKEKEGDLSYFKEFETIIENQLEVYNEEASNVNISESLDKVLTLNGAIELFNINILALLMRHAAVYRLVLTGDEITCMKLAGLIQSLIPIHITTSLNEYTDIFVTNDPLVSSNIRFTLFNVMDKTWIDKKFEKADFERDLLKEVLKKKQLSNMDMILLFRQRYMQVLGKVTDLINTFWKNKDDPNLRKILDKLIKDKNEMEFLKQYVLKNIGINIDEIL
ncbi:MAG: hypothetical protein ACTSU2_09015 [Promethearchaeota archaeon]